ncbi:hypothetical protein ACHWQZ_G017978 [Mnemiopsis leidyi]
MSYDLILFFNCGCSGNTHKFECSLQQRLRLTVETPPGYCCVKLGSFAIPDLEEIRDKALTSWRMYEFDIVVEPPLKKFERNGRKTYVGLISMDQEHMSRLNDLIVEMEQYFGPIRDYQPYLIDICERDPEKPKKHPELLLFDEFSLKISEVRLVEYETTRPKSNSPPLFNNPPSPEPGPFVIDGQETFRTTWRLKLLNEKTDPAVLQQLSEIKLKKHSRRQSQCLVFSVLLVLLLGLAGIIAFLIWYNQEAIFGSGDSSSGTSSRTFLVNQTIDTTS